MTWNRNAGKIRTMDDENALRLISVLTDDDLKRILTNLDTTYYKEFDVQTVADFDLMLDTLCLLVKYGASQETIEEWLVEQHLLWLFRDGIQDCIEKHGFSICDEFIIKTLEKDPDCRRTLSRIDDGRPEYPIFYEFLKRTHFSPNTK